MRISGVDILEAKWTFSEANLMQVAKTVIMEGRIGGNFGITTPNVTLDGVVEVNIPQSAWRDGLQEAVIWAAKQRLGIGNYWMLNRWGRWEEYGYRDIAADWAMDKAIRLTNKVGQKIVDRATRTPSPYQPWTTVAAPIRPATVGAGSAGVTFLLAGLLIPAFMGGIDAWGLNPNNSPPLVN